LRQEREADQKQQYGRLLTSLSRKDANQFLRNGFFQDPAVARLGDDAATIIIASSEHWQKPELGTQAQALEVVFINPPPKPPTPSGYDAEIFDLVKESW
jgi:hypothetical protein